jgi:hypothetical protein
MAKMEFIGVDNMKSILSIFQKYMLDKYNVDINEFDDTNSRIVLYNILKSIQERDPNGTMPLKQLNNIALNEMRDFYVNKYNIVESKKPNVQSLERERQVHGTRTVQESQINRPMNTAIKEDGANVEKEFERLMNIRQGIPDAIPAMTATTTPQPIEPKIIKPISADDFKKKLLDLESSRDHQLQSNLELIKSQPPLNDDPKQFYTQMMKTSDAKRDAQRAVQNAPPPTYTNAQSSDLVNFTSKLRKSPTYYITINGFDRDWTSFRKRFAFSVDMNKMSRSYKNVHEIAFTKLIIPSEIIEERTLTNIPKTSYANNFKFGYPYILLQVEEFPDVYDGINQANRRAFTQFIYEANYQAPNGRGYITLAPVQEECKVFYPTPLSALQRLTMTIAKPNGTIFNNSEDGFAVWKVEYEDYNKMHLKIVLEKYFDKNEFFTGDIIMIRNFKIPFYESLTDPAYIEYQTKRALYDQIMEFINRPEGHEIVEFGQPNEEGFYRNFYIQAPCTVDPTKGKYVIEKTLVDTIQHFNRQSYTCCAHPIPNGAIINTSLQPVLSMQVRLAIGDAVQALNPQII